MLNDPGNHDVRIPRKGDREPTDSPRATAASKPLPMGTLLQGRYRIHGVLKKNSLSVTYFATDTLDGGERNIKEYFPPALAVRAENGTFVLPTSPEEAVRFQRGRKAFLEEAGVLLELRDCASFPPTRDGFLENGTAYVCMERIEGGSLTDLERLLGRRPGPKEIAALLYPVMKDLEKLHEKGLIHGNIAPETLLVDRDYRKIVLDFAARRGWINGLEDWDDTLLKRGFAPPEQYAPGGEIGPWTDVYAMALSFCCGLFGLVPPDAREPQEHFRSLLKNLLFCELGETACDLLMVALEPSCRSRFQNMGAFRRALQGCLEDEAGCAEGHGETIHAPAPPSAAAAEEREADRASALSGWDDGFGPWFDDAPAPASASPDAPAGESGTAHGSFPYDCDDEYASFSDGASCWREDGEHGEDDGADFGAWSGAAPAPGFGGGYGQPAPGFGGGYGQPAPGFGGGYGQPAPGFGGGYGQPAPPSGGGFWQPGPQWYAPPAPTRTPRVSDVQFSALFPKRFLKGEYTILELYIYTEEERRVLDEAIAEAQGSLKESRSGKLKVSEGARIGVRLSSADPSVEIDGDEETQTWNGGYLKFDFSVFLPDNYPKRQLMFTATVLFNGVPATRLRFTAECNTLREQRMQVERQDVLRAFISYASQDRSRVAGIIQGMLRARPDLDLFFDVDSLRCGEDWQRALRAEIEKRDILFLCWSVSARNSAWVEREWRYALECKGLDAIEPIAIDPPDRCPPPAELLSKHFNDRTLYYIRD